MPEPTTDNAVRAHEPDAPAAPDPNRTPAAIADLKDEIDAAIGDSFTRVELARTLREASEYAVLGPGKRVRPALCLRCAQAAGGGAGPASARSAAERKALAMPAAMALEMVHAFSLVHDDLPALDGDELRRGRPTLHVHAGEAMAVLAGDLLLVRALEVIAEGPFDDRTARLVSRELAAATRDMVSGQVYDTMGDLPEGLDDRGRVDLIHRKKTGALLTAACRLGPLAAGEPPESAELGAITGYAERVGLMFQIVDDLLDVEQVEDHTGKRTGKDAEAGKITFPSVLGVERSRRRVAELESEALEAIAPLGPPAEPLRELCRWLAIRTR